MTNWKSYKLGEFADVQTGPFGSQLHASDYVEKGIPSIMPVNIVDHKFEEAGIARITPIDAKRLNKYLVTSGDVVFSRRGEIHRRALVTDKENGWLCGTGCLRARLRSTDEVDPQFLYFYFGIDEVRDWLYGHAVGTSMPNLNSGILSNLPIALPDLPTQHRIAEILSALDDKIELNRRMNQTLEQMAQTLFRQYFVDGIDEENLPEGWRKGKLGEIVNVKGGTTPSTKQPEFWNGSINWTSPKDLSSARFPVLLDTDKKITEAGLKKISSGLLPVGTLLLSSRAPIGYLAITQIPVAVNQGYIAILCEKGYSNYFMLFWLKENMNTIIQNANGSTFLEISKSVFKGIDLSIPSVELVQEFDTKVDAIFQKLVLNEKEIRKLTQIRDTLLPKLMSGEIDVMQSKLTEQHEPILS